MNKLVIPVILISVIMIATAFAFVPVEQSISTHVSITDTLGELICPQVSGEGYHPELLPDNPCAIIED